MKNHAWCLWTRMLAVLLLLVLPSCGVSPQDAGEELERSAQHPDEWCGWDPPAPQQDVEKAFNHPDGYGVTASYGCFDGDWDGDFCYAPRTLVQRIRPYTDGQDSTWFKKLTDELGAIRTRMNNEGWTVSRWQTGDPAHTIEGRTSMDTNPGVLGAADYYDLTFYEFDEGDYITYHKCVATLFRARIEANIFFQSATATQQDKYLKNLWDHEMGGHCFGLPHTDTVDLLMSATYYFPGPRFNTNLNPTAAELQMFDDFEPLN